MKKIETTEQLKRIIEESPHGIVIAECSKHFRTCWPKFVDDPRMMNQFLVNGHEFDKCISEGESEMMSRSCSVEISTIDMNIDKPNGYNDWYLYAETPVKANLDALKTDGYFEFMSAEKRTAIEAIISHRKVQELRRDFLELDEMVKEAIESAIETSPEFNSEWKNCESSVIYQEISDEIPFEYSEQEIIASIESYRKGLVET